MRRPTVFAVMVVTPVLMVALILSFEKPEMAVRWCGLATIACLTVVVAWYPGHQKFMKELAAETGTPATRKRKLWSGLFSRKRPVPPEKEVTS